jgi:hypothetical protein
MDEAGIGQKLMEFRDKRRSTPDKIAGYTGFSKSYLSRIVNYINRKTLNYWSE